jgi:malate dehydrogenase (oxaloacetate-decarboxylating)
VQQSKKLENIKVVISRAGSAGYGIFKFLEEAGCKDIVVTDSKCAIYDGRKDLIAANSQNLDKREIIANSNPRKLVGSLEEVIRKADVFSANYDHACILFSVNRDRYVYGFRISIF